MQPRYMEHFSGGIRCTVIINGYWYWYSVHSAIRESLLFYQNICALSTVFFPHFHHQPFTAPGKPIILVFSLQKKFPNCDVSTLNGTVISEMVEDRSVQSLTFPGSHRYLSELYRFRCTQVTLKVGNWEAQMWGRPIYVRSYIFDLERPTAER